MLIRFHPEARAEYDAAVRWYQRQSQSAARNFVAAIQNGLDSIIGDPHRFERVAAGGQRCGVADFPFSIYFEYEPGQIYVFAVAHGSRRPDYWHDRITNR